MKPPPPGTSESKTRFPFCTQQTGFVPTRHLRNHEALGSLSPLRLSHGFEKEYCPTSRSTPRVRLNGLHSRTDDRLPRSRPPRATVITNKPIDISRLDVQVRHSPQTSSNRKTVRYITNPIFRPGRLSFSDSDHLAVTQSAALMLRNRRGPHRSAYAAGIVDALIYDMAPMTASRRADSPTRAQNSRHQAENQADGV